MTLYLLTRASVIVVLLRYTVSDSKSETSNMDDRFPLSISFHTVRHWQVSSSVLHTKDCEGLYFGPWIWVFLEVLEQSLLSVGIHGIYYLYEEAIFLMFFCCQFQKKYCIPSTSLLLIIILSTFVIDFHRGPIVDELWKNTSVCSGTGRTAQIFCGKTGSKDSWLIEFQNFR